ERLVDADMPGAPHRPREEPGIEQMQDGVLDAADILVDRQAVVARRAGDRAVRPRRAEAREVPGRIHEGVAGVGFAPRGGAAGRTGRVLPGRMMVERVTRPLEAHIV